MKGATKIVFLSCLVAILVVPLLAHGTVITHYLVQEFSGADPPQGTQPPAWLTATFDDSFGGANTVRLTMAATNLVGTEFVDDWLFNLDPVLDPTLLSFAAVGTQPASPIAVQTGVNAFKADGDGWYDILVDYTTSGAQDRFTANEVVTYDITYTAPMTALAFDYPSSTGGGQGTYDSAAHVQGIYQDESGSGWIGPNGIPEPGALLLIGSLLIGLGIISRRKF